MIRNATIKDVNIRRKIASNHHRKEKLLLLYIILAASPLASRGFAPRDDKKKCKAKFVKKKKMRRTKEIFYKGPRISPKIKKIKIEGGFFCFWGVGGVPPP